MYQQIAHIFAGDLRMLFKEILLDLAQSVYIDGSVSIKTTHHHKSDFLGVGQILPSFSYHRVTVFSSQIWVHALHNGDLFASEEAICCQKLKLSSRFDSSVVHFKFDIMNFGPYFIHFLFVYFQALQIIFPLFLGHFVKLIYFVRTEHKIPLVPQMVTDFSWTQKRLLLFCTVEMFIFKNSVSWKRLSWLATKG